MAKVGYGRVSTLDQRLDSQLEQLQQTGCDKIYQEKASGSSTYGRPQLQLMLDYIREGDIVVVCKLDRIARSTIDLLHIVQQLERKGVAFLVLNINLDTSTPTGKLMLSMLAAIGQFERELMLERQKEGIAKAKQRGAYTGRKPTARAKGADIIRLLELGVPKAQIAERLNVGLSSVYRIIEEKRPAEHQIKNKLSLNEIVDAFIPGFHDGEVMITKPIGAEKM